MTYSYTITFNKSDFINAISILGFQHLYAIDKIENKNLKTYINERKNIYVEIKPKPFCISIVSKKQSFSETSYERAYTIIHGLT